MSAGLQVFNKEGVEIINTNDPNLVVISRGTMAAWAGGGIPAPEVTVSYQGWPEAPFFLIRPRPGLWYGAATMFKRSNNTVSLSLSSGNMNTFARAEFDWALCCSPKASKVEPVSNFGLEVFDDNGDLIFSSNNLYPRIINIQRIKGPYSLTGGPINQSVTIDKVFTEMPWVNIRDACLSYPHPAGPDGSYSEEFSIMISSDFKTLSARISDSLSPEYNQYQNGYMYYPLCIIPGT